MVARNEVKPITRREFLYYGWGAGAGLLGISVCGASAWYAMPNLEAGEGIVEVNFNDIPVSMEYPTPIREGGYWLIITPRGLLALHRMCTKGDYMYKWVPTNGRFECPGCGSKFSADGTYIEGPALRDLDRLTIYATTPRGIVYTPSDGAPINVEEATKIVVNVRRIIRGQSKSS